MTPPPTLPPPASRAAPPVRSMVASLVPVLVPLVAAAIVLSVWFARAFPPAPAQAAPTLRFTDITTAAGLRFSHQQGGPEAPTTLGGGVTVFDFNQDGRPDLFFPNGAPWPWEETLEKRPARSGALYRNDGGGRFTDVTFAAGLNVEMQAMAAVAGDFDHDGLPDLFVACIGRNRLFRNLGLGRFEEVTEEAGVGGDDTTWSTGAAWLDCDRDGRLDLIVLHYARWPAGVPLAQAFVIADIGRSYGAPAGFGSAFPTVYRNLGGGRFAPVANSAGLRDLDPETRRAVAQPLAIVPVDADGDQRLDLLISYHAAPTALFLNQGDGTFRKVARLPDRRREGASAGLAGSSALPFEPADGADERFRALQALRGGSAPAGTVSLESRLAVAAGDFDFNGRLELFAGGGLAEAGLNNFAHGRDFARTPRLLWQAGTGWQAEPVRGEQRDDVLPAVTARGIAVADFDGDGDLDLVIAQNNGAPHLLRNDQRDGLPWLRLHLTATRSSADAAGARVEVHTPRRIHVQTASPALGYLAQSESTLTFGLGDDARVRRVVIHWPSGQVQELKPEGLNRLLEIREP